MSVDVAHTSLFTAEINVVFSTETRHQPPVTPFDERFRPPYVYCMDLYDAQYHLWQHPNPTQAPHHQLARAIWAKALNPAAIKAANEDVFNLGCTQAEPRLVRDLQRQAAVEEPEENRAASAILYDIHDVPYGYLKADGVRTVRTWRDAEVATQRGVKQVPGDAILEIKWQAGNPQEQYAACGLVALHHGVHVPKSLGFVRMGIDTLTPEVRSNAFNVSAMLEHNLAEYMEPASKITSEKIGQQVLALTEIATHITA